MFLSELPVHRTVGALSCAARDETLMGKDCGRGCAIFPLDCQIKI